MKSLLFTKLAIFIEFKSVLVILLVLLGIVISLFALGTCERDLNSHRILLIKEYYNLLRFFHTKN